MKNKKSKMDIASILKDLQKSEVQSTNNPIIREILQIDSRAFEMALHVAEKPAGRKKLKAEAVKLMQRLDSLADKLEAENPEDYKKVTDQISESQLDLLFVEQDNDMISLRLGTYLCDVESDSGMQKPVDDKELPGQLRKNQGEIRDRIKFTITHFLKHALAIDQPEIDKFLSTLSQPVARFDEVKGSFWQLENEYAKIRLTAGDSTRLRVFRYSAKIPIAENRPELPRDYPEADALKLAKNIAAGAVADFENRNFVLTTTYEHGLYHFKWKEQPAGRILSVPPNYIKILLDRKTLALEYFSVFDFAHWRTESTKITKERAHDIAQKELSGKWRATAARLWERIRNGGRDVRTVWTVTLSFPIPEAETVEDVVIDADSGEIIEGNPE